MCGMGRTGHFFATEADAISPDIITIAKGLGGGYQPIGAMLCSQTIFDTIRDGSGFFSMAIPIWPSGGLCGRTCCHPQAHRSGDDAAGTRARRDTERGIAGKVRPAPPYRQYQGRGLFQGMEFVADRESKTPFAPEAGFHRRFKKAAFDAGLICYPMGGTIDGRNGDHVLLAPPFIISEDQIGEMVDKLDIALKETVSGS